MSNTMNRAITLKKASSTDLNNMKPLIRGAFESSLMDGIGYIDNSMLPDDGLDDMLMMSDMTIYKAVADEQLVGGAIVKIDDASHHNVLELLFVNPSYHSHGAGYEIWKALENLYPDTEVWETETPEFSSRNIHFYVNKCGFHIVEYFNKHHPYAGVSNDAAQEEIPYGMYRFKKYMKGVIS